MSLPKPKVVKKKVDELTKAPTNVRFEYPEEKMDVLRKSIRSMGLLELPKVTPEGKVFAGWGRVEACKAEGIKEIYVVEIGSMSPREQMIASLTENFARADLDDSELRIAIKKLRDEEGLTPAEISRVTGMNISTIHQHLSFYRLPEELREDIEEDIATLPMYSISHINQAVQNVPKEKQVTVGKKMVELAQQRHPSGKRIAQQSLKEIADQAKLGRDVVPIIDKIIEEAAKQEYIVFSVSVPERRYIPHFKLAKLQGKTIQERINDLMEDTLEDTKKQLSL